MSAIYGDSQIVSELTRLGVEAADAKSAMLGKGESFQAVLWSFCEKVLKLDRCVRICAEHTRQLATCCDGAVVH